MKEEFVTLHNLRWLQKGNSESKIHVYSFTLYSLLSFHPLYPTVDFKEDDKRR